MRSAAYAVRVGALAVALGIGATTGGAGAASAEASPGQPPGLYVSVVDGFITIKDRPSSVLFTPGQFGFVPAAYLPPTPSMVFAFKPPLIVLTPPPPIPAPNGALQFQRPEPDGSPLQLVRPSALENTLKSPNFLGGVDKASEYAGVPGASSQRKLPNPVSLGNVSQIASGKASTAGRASRASAAESSRP